MKGKLYAPQGKAKSQDVSMKKSQSNHNLRTNSLGSVECIWPSSIPESWKKIMKLKNLPSIKVQKSSRNTLAFLQETQRYIENICKPMQTDEIHIVPSCYKPIKSVNIKQKLIDKGKSPQETRIQELRSNFMRRRKRRIEKKQSISPVQSSGIHRATNSCHSIRITFREYE